MLRAHPSSAPGSPSANRRFLRILTAAALVLSAMLAATTLWACGGTHTAVTTEATSRAPLSAAPDSVPALSRQTLLDSGRVYYQACAICHGGNGRGGRGPAVANSDYVQGGRARLIRTVLEGVREPILVNGVRWKTGEMLGWAEVWDDFKIAAVLTYVRVTLNDSLVTECIPENFETGTWASCTLAPRTPEEISRDSVALAEVAAVRAAR